MNSVLKRIWTIVSSTLLGLVVIFVILISGVRLAGIKPYSVLSGSMEPTYHVGSLIYVKDVDSSDLKVGDAVTFKLNSGNTVVTHRIALINKDDKTVITKGDANEVADAKPVEMSNIVGKVVFNIPVLGYIASFVATVQGKIIAITAAFVLIILVMLPDWLDKADKEDKHNEEDKKNKENEDKVKSIK